MHLFQMLSLKTPLQYFGAKSRATPKLMPFIPSSTTEIISPFIGGGSFELALTGRGIRVYGYDAFPPVVRFWRQLLTEPVAMIEPIRRFVQRFYDGELDKKKDLYQDLTTDAERAAMFIVVNNLSFNSNANGGMSLFEINKNGEPVKAKYLTNRMIRFERISNFHNPLLSVNLVDFRESLVRHGEMFAYLDPPYPEIDHAYGDAPQFHETFPHVELAGILHNRQNWMLSYNNCQTVLDLYPPADFRYDYPKWHRDSKIRNTAEDCNEVLIRPK